MSTVYEESKLLWKHLDSKVEIIKETQTSFITPQSPVSDTSTLKHMYPPEPQKNEKSKKSAVPLV
jgi:hypothetical protein